MLLLVQRFPPSFTEHSAELQRVLGMAHWNAWNAEAAHRHLAQSERLFADGGHAEEAPLTRAHRAIVLIGQGHLCEASTLLTSLVGLAPAVGNAIFDATEADFEARVVQRGEGGRGRGVGGAEGGRRAQALARSLPRG